MLSDDINAIRNVKFRLKHLANEQGLLTVTSNHVVLEPIAQLTVVSHCESSFTRQYSLLIDPSSGQPGGILNQNIDTFASAYTIIELTDGEPSEPLVTHKPAPQPKAARPSSGRNVAQTTLKTKPSASWNPQTGDITQTNNKASRIEATPSQPKLTISGGHLSTSALNPFSPQLSLDRSLHTSHELDPQAYAAAAEFADEVTVMNNRLAHLEKQLTGLYSTNAKLETDNQENAAALSAMKHQNDVLRTLSFCLGGGLLGCGYFFVDWFRRRKADKEASKTHAVWEDLEQIQDAEEPVQAFKIDENYIPAASTDSFEVKTQDDLTEFEQTHIFNAPFLVSDAPILEENALDVIEDADVFLSHGRTSLAVQLLQHHLINAPKKSAATWLFLLDLLAKEGMQKEFDIAAHECKKHFNVHLAEFSSPANEANNLESFERISAELQKIWGTPEALLFLDELIYNTRMEPRMGFDKAVFEELVLLREIAEAEMNTPQAMEEIILTSSSTDRPNTPKENVVKLNLPEIEMSEDFKSSCQELTMVADNKKISDETEHEHFEFELMELAKR